MKITKKTRIKDLIPKGYEIEYCEYNEYADFIKIGLKKIENYENHRRNKD
jgi:hypothetical protein